jgi:hypothetical protein
MTDLELITELKELQKKLKHGEQRELARRLTESFGELVYPGRVSDAFYGLVRDVEFLERLQAECQKLIGEREPIKA